MGLGAGTTANDVSANGRVVVGAITNYPYCWKSGRIEVLRLFPYPDRFPLSQESSVQARGGAAGISGDGNIIVGSYMGTALESGGAYRWDMDSEPSTMVGKNSFSDTSADGAFWVGFTYFSASYRAFRKPYPGDLNLSSSSGNTLPYAISSDGAVVVGKSSSLDSSTGGFEAFKWTTNGMVGIGFLPGKTTSGATGISADGNVIIGYSGGDDFTGYYGAEAFRWTEAGGMVGLGDLPGGASSSSATAANHDGSIIVGRGSSENGTEPFFWDSTNGMRSLKSVLEASGLDLSGWILTTVSDISSNGTVIVGNGTNALGQAEGWLAVLSGTNYSASWVQPPTGLSATALSSSQLKISWASTPNATGYKLQRKEGTNTWTTIGLLGQNGTNYIDSFSGTYRLYRVSATNENDSSFYSAPLEISTGSFSFETPTYSTGENDPTVAITVMRSASNSGMATVNFTTENGTAQAGEDYVNTNGTLVFTNGQTSNAFSIRLLKDVAEELNETVILRLTDPTVGTTVESLSNATLTINNSSPQELSFLASAQTVSEDATNLIVTVTRKNGVGGTAAVDFNTVDEAAVSASDYVATNGTLFFADGESNRTFTVTILNDDLVEADETFSIQLSNPMEAILVAPTNNTVTIQDDQIGLGLSSATYTANESEGEVLISVVRTGRLTETVSVDFATANGTAQVGSDYTQTEGTLIFASGDTTKAFTIPFSNDQNIEGRETVSILLSNPNGAVLTTSDAVLTIAEDPVPGTSFVTSCDEAGLLTALSEGTNVFCDCDGTIYLTNPITITTNITLDANGHSVAISGSGSNRLFYVTSNASLSLDGLTLQDGVSTNHGGAIYNDSGVVHLNNCVVSNNIAVGVQGSSGGGPFTPPTRFITPAFGGAIFNHLGTLTVSNSTFESNHALGRDGENLCFVADLCSHPTGGEAGTTGAGGAIYNTGTFESSNVIYTDNTAVGGKGNAGRIWNFGGRTGGIGGPGSGGAIFNSGTAHIIQNTLLANIARAGNGGVGSMGGEQGGWWYGGIGGSGGEAAGGGILNSGTMEIVTSTFATNTAHGGAGASGGNAAGGTNANPIYTAPGGIGGSGNKGLGGAIQNLGELHILDSTFTNNSAIGGTPGTGGAGNNSTYAQNGAGGSAFGGSIHNSGTLTMTNNTIGSNTVYSGGPEGGGANIFYGPAEVSSGNTVFPGEVRLTTVLRTNDFPLNTYLTLGVVGSDLPEEGYEWRHNESVTEATGPIYSTRLQPDDIGIYSVNFHESHGEIRRLEIHQPTAQFFGMGAGTKVNAVSGNGRVVVGALAILGNSDYPIHWRSGQAETVKFFAYFDNRIPFAPPIQAYGYANAVSRDGSVILGRYEPRDPDNFGGLFRWDESGVEKTSGRNMIFSDLSADASFWLFVAFGGADSSQAYRFPQPGNLGSLPGLNLVTANAMSADGSIIVGSCYTPVWKIPGGREAFRWTTNGMVGMGFLPGMTGSAAIGISADGNVIIGTVGSTNGSQSFRWTEFGGMVGLGDFPGGALSSSPTAVNHDGSIIVGHGTSENGSEPYIWDATNGMRRLLGVLEENGVDFSNWTSISVSDISWDGMVIVGNAINALGKREGWLVDLAPGDYTASWIKPPTNLTVVALSPSQLKFSWNSTPNATGYRFQRQEADGAWATIGLLSQNTTNYIDSFSGTHRFYRVAATNQIDTSFYSSELEIPAGSFFFATNTYITGENETALLITVMRSLIDGGVASVNFTTENGTAQAGLDYAPTNGTLVFTNGQTSHTFSVRLLKDMLTEPNETVTLRLSNPTLGTSLGTFSNATITITNSTPQQFSFLSTAHTVNEDGTNLVVTVTRKNGVGGTASVNFNTIDGTAIGGVDYAATNGTLFFANGESNRTFTISILNDGLLETNETFQVQLTNPTEAAIVAPSNSTITIQDDESGLSFGSVTYSANELDGFAVINVMRTGRLTRTVSVDFTTANGTAQADTDYSPTQGTLIFPPGDTLRTFSIPISHDQQLEGRETVSILLSNSGNAVLVTSNAVLTIIDAEGDRFGQFIALGAGTTANAVSGNGRVVVGAVTNYPFHWKNGQFEILSFFPYQYLYPFAGWSDQGTGAASAVSSDGSVIVGSFNPYGTEPLGGAFRWDESHVATSNGRIYFSDTSAHGSFWLQGTSAGGEVFQAYRLPSPGDLGSLGTGLPQSSPAAISADGSIVVGKSRSTNSPTEADEAFRWTTNGMVGIGFLPEQTDSAATGISADGNVIIGQSGSEAFRWTQAGGMIGLGDLTGGDFSSFAKAANHDGSIIVGHGSSENGTEPFFWDATNGMRRLRDVFGVYNIDLSGWTSISVSDISADGMVIVGNGTNSGGQQEGWLVNLAGTNYSASWVQPPTGLTATAPSSTQLKISWASTANATGYKLQRKEGTNDWITIALLNQNTTNYIDTFPTVSRSYRVAATNAIEVSFYSSSLEIPAGSFSFESNTYTTSENNSTVVITVIRSGDTNVTASVNFSTANGTALAGQDYVSTNGTLVFTNGQTTQTFAIRPLRDILAESSETVSLRLTNPTVGTSLGVNSNAVLTINNALPQRLSLLTSTNTVTENGPNLVVTVIRDNGVGGTASVSFATVNGTAASGADYLATNGTLHFAEGESSKTFSVTILNDGLAEPNETFGVRLTNAVDAILFAPTNSTITIQDDEGSLSLSSATYAANESEGEALISVVRTGRLTETVSVNFATLNGSAQAGSDYSATSGTLIFAPGELTKAFIILVSSDEVIEGSETVAISLSDPSGAVLVVSNAVLTITDHVRSGGDVDQDGHTDVVMQNDDGRVAAWLMQGTNFIMNQSLPATYVEPGWRLIALADFNQDFKPDYILRNATSVRVGRIGSSPLSFTRNIAPEWGYVGSGDMNRDGHPDLVWQHTDGRLMTWLLGDFTFMRAAWLREGKPAAAGWRGKGVADFNGDGHEDILLHHSDGRMAVWFMNETNWSSSIFLNEGKSSGAGWRLVGLNDLNDDGHADILWQHTDRRLFARFMTQTNFIGGNFLRNGAPIKPGWRVVGVR